MKYVTHRARFESGDYPMVCVQSGRPADALLPVDARHRAVWPFLLVPFNVISFIVSKIFTDRRKVRGRLPFDTAGLREPDAYKDLAPSVSVTYERAIGVIINGAHPNFIEATKRAQGRAIPE